MVVPHSTNYAIIPGKMETVDISATDHSCPATMAALYVGGSGDVVIEDLAGNNTTLVSVPVGFHSMRVNKVVKTNTTATDMAVLFA